MKDTYHMIFKNTKMQWNELNLSEKYGDNNNHTIYIFVYHSEFNEQRIETVLYCVKDSESVTRKPNCRISFIL